MSGRRAAALAVCGVVGLSALADGETTGSLAADYAESVAVYGLSPDGRAEVRFRLGRRPAAGTAVLWLSVVAGRTTFAVVEEGIELAAPAAATTVGADRALFGVADPARISVVSQARHGASMGARVHAITRAHRTRHPPVGPGEWPLRLDIEFHATHPLVSPRPGRREVFGEVSATVVSADGRFEVRGPGKWHEQVGPRPTFAPAFTYLWGASADAGLLARGGGGTAWGFLREADRLTPVDALRIDPPGASRRAFEVTLADGRRVRGSATALRDSSVPIEGRRRPSVSVRIDSDVGALVGHLNDWNPAAEERP